MAAEQEALADHPVRWWAVPFGSAVAAVVLLIYVTVLQTREATTAAALLTLSICVDLFVLQRQRLDSRFSNELSRCELAKAIALGAYLILEKSEVPNGLFAAVLSVATLVAGLLVAVVMVTTVTAMMRPAAPDDGRRRPISSIDELRSDKVLALSGLLVAFLHITYFFAFALAFSDRFVSRDLWAFRLGDDPPATGGGGTTHAAQDQGLPSCGSDEFDRVRKFFFVQSAATLACTEETCKAADLDKALSKTICESGVMERLSAFEPLKLPGCGEPADPLQRRASAWNARELYELRALFRELATSGEPQAYLVEIRGHANDTKLKGDPAVAYGSNYEISKQRADQVSLLLNDQFRKVRAGLDEPPVRWLAYGVSNEASFLDPRTDAWTPALPLEQKLSVEVRLHKVAEPFNDKNIRKAQSSISGVVASTSTPRRLELIDYLYFTVYTITTTGYGDIVPTSSYAKLLVSLANLIELLFVVVLVNVVSNTKAGGDHAIDR